MLCKERDRNSAALRNRCSRIWLEREASALWPTRASSRRPRLWFSLLALLVDHQLRCRLRPTSTTTAPRASTRTAAAPRRSRTASSAIGVAQPPARATTATGQQGGTTMRLRGLSRGTTGARLLSLSPGISARAEAARSDERMWGGRRPASHRHSSFSSCAELSLESCGSCADPRPAPSWTTGLTSSAARATGATSRLRIAGRQASSSVACSPQLKTRTTARTTRVCLRPSLFVLERARTES